MSAPQDPIGSPMEEHETISLSDEKAAGAGKTKLVQNAALSQATAIAKPSMLTWRMFQVGIIRFYLLGFKLIRK